jgi:hypothetical protein
MANVLNLIVAQSIVEQMSELKGIKAKDHKSFAKAAKAAKLTPSCLHSATNIERFVVVRGGVDMGLTVENAARILLVAENDQKRQNAKDKAKKDGIEWKESEFKEMPNLGKGWLEVAEQFVGTSLELPASSVVTTDSFAPVGNLFALELERIAKEEAAKEEAAKEEAAKEETSKETKPTSKRGK